VLIGEHLLILGVAFLPVPELGRVLVHEDIEQLSGNAFEAHFT
jgi:hypothetical protein